MVTDHEPQRGYWGGLAASERAALTDVANPAEFAPGSLLLAQRDMTGDVVVIWSGFAKVVTRVAGGRSVVLALRGPGDLLGEMAYVRGGTRSAAVAAINRVKTLRVLRADFSVFLSGSANASQLLKRTLVDRLREADRDRVAAASMTVGQRLALLLLRLTRQYGKPSPRGGLTIALLSQEELATCVGGARRTVARQIGQWRDRNIVSTDRMSITVREPQALARIVKQTPPSL